MKIKMYYTGPHTRPGLYEIKPELAEKLKQLPHWDVSEPVYSPSVKSLESMSKDELELYAARKYGVDLDKRKKIEDLVKQVRKLGG